MHVTPPHRQTLLEQLHQIEAAEREILRRRILSGRPDLLASEILGYDVAPHHKEILVHQEAHQECLIVVWRGAGKTTIGTIVRVVYEVLRNPNIRILIASKARDNAKKMLSAIKKHLMSGEVNKYFGNQVGEKWDEYEVTVAGRTAVHKEPTISTIGQDSTVISAHYDLIIADDLVAQETARTQYLRRKTEIFWYKTLLPTLEPDGRIYVLGTRYHPEDLYGHLASSEMLRSNLDIKAMVGSDDDGWKAVWPEKFPVDWLLKRRKGGRVYFETQYMNNVDLMVSGGIIEVDNCIEIVGSQVSSTAIRFMGVDLATGMEDKNDNSAICVVAVQPDSAIAPIDVIDYIEGKFTFVNFRKLIAEKAEQHKVALVGVEAIAYQAIMAQELTRKYPNLGIVPIKQRIDKKTRFFRRAPLFESQRVRFTPRSQGLIPILVGFPNHYTDDGFDAFDHALTVAYGRGRKRRDPKNEPGLF